jgi:hypothetical protein
VTIVLVKRLRDVWTREDAEALADRLGRQLQLLEARTVGAVGTLESSAVVS